MVMKVVPKNWYCWNFELTDADSVLADIAMSSWKEKAAVLVQAVEYQAFREGSFSGAFLLASGGRVICSAEKPSAFRQQFIISTGRGEVTLKSESALRRTMGLYQHSNRVGIITPESVFKRSAVVDLPENLSPA